MPVRSFTASRVHGGHGWLPEFTTLVVDDAGCILELLSAPLPDTRILPGVLCPGFVNAHCHLELSHLKGLAPEKTGITDFLIFMTSRRGAFESPYKTTAMRQALEELKRNGIVAVGDIANSTDTLSLRQEADIIFHTFIEALGMAPAVAEKRFTYYKEVYEQFAAQTGLHRQSITPHAPYSVSKELFQLIDSFHPHSLLSIHNQEGNCENELFRSGGGDLHRLFTVLGLLDVTFPAKHSNSLPVYSAWLDQRHPMILVHNTFCESTDLAFAKTHFPNLWFCLCPNANLYIEGRLPDVPQLLEAGVQICIGTDSLASNHQLSVLYELQTLKNNFEFLDWETLLHWGTLHGAEALQMADKLGDFSVGKQPGILHLSGLETKEPRIERLT